MSKFTKLSKSSTLTNKGKTIKVSIYKFIKEGTKRVFFAPEVEGLRINSTMFARLGNAEQLAKAYINHKSK